MPSNNVTTQSASPLRSLAHTERAQKTQAKAKPSPPREHPPPPRLGGRAAASPRSPARGDMHNQAPNMIRCQATRTSVPVVPVTPSGPVSGRPKFRTPKTMMTGVTRRPHAAASLMPQRIAGRFVLAPVAACRCGRDKASFDFRGPPPGTCRHKDGPLRGGRPPSSPARDAEAHSPGRHKLNARVLEVSVQCVDQPGLTRPARWSRRCRVPPPTVSTEARQQIDGNLPHAAPYASTSDFANVAEGCNPQTKPPCIPKAPRCTR